MTDPRPDDGADFSALEGGDQQQALDTVRAVVQWYNAQLLAERRAPVPDEERVEDLKAARQEAIEDQTRLLETDEDQAARIGARYAARLSELRNSSGS